MLSNLLNFFLKNRKRNANYLGRFKINIYSILSEKKKKNYTSEIKTQETIE